MCLVITWIDDLLGNTRWCNCIENSFKRTSFQKICGGGWWLIFWKSKVFKKKKQLFQYLFFDTQIYSHEYLNLSHVSAFVFFSLLQVSIIEFSKNFKSSTLFNQWEYSVLIQYGVQNILYLLIFFHCDDSCLWIYTMYNVISCWKFCLRLSFLFSLN